MYLFPVMFVAVVWSSLLPSVKRKNDLLLAIVPDEKSWLLKDDKEKPTESYEKKHGRYVKLKNQPLTNFLGYV